MQQSSHFTTRPNQVQVLFEDHALSFGIPRGATFADLASRLEGFTNPHADLPIDISVRISSLPLAWSMS